TPCLSGHQKQILGVDVQLVAVQLGQLGKGVLNVVQVLHGFPEGGEHFLAMGTDVGVANDGAGAGEVPEGGEEPLGPGVDDQVPDLPSQGLGTALGHVDLAPKATDELVACSCREVRRKSRLLLPWGLPAGQRLTGWVLLFLSYYLMVCYLQGSTKKSAGNVHCSKRALLPQRAC
uniref:Uncharacterized protein n=1 Tax=Dromaius novaehollandiae TaxID=8790 RepID=A0A8C4IYK4_DRONO